MTGYILGQAGVEAESLAFVDLGAAILNTIALP